MRILFAGTGAAEGWPGIFCECDACARAKILGGKNFRSRCSVHFDSEYKVDLPPDTYLHILKYDLNFADIKYLFITHDHYDHLHSDDLLMRQEPFAHMSKNNMHIYGSQDVTKSIIDRLREPSKMGLILHTLKPFETVNAGEFRVKALLADHDPNKICFIYLFESRNKVILYGHDSGWFPEETWKELDGFRLDLAILDCTTGAFPSRRNHMGLKEVIEMREYMILKNIADKDTIFVATHFSHNGRLLYDELVEKLYPRGIKVAYDGLTIEI